MILEEQTVGEYNCWTVSKHNFDPEEMHRTGFAVWWNYEHRRPLHKLSIVDIAEDDKGLEFN